MNDITYKFGLIAALLLIGISLTPLEVNAQTSNFTGLTIEAASGYQSMRISPKNLMFSNSALRINNRSIPNSIAPKNISGVPYALNVGYIFGVGDYTTLGVRLEYNPLSSRYAAVILPGYVLTERTQAYLRFGWAYMASKISATFPNVPSQTQTALFRGPTIGIGAKYKLIDKFYLYSELNYYQYNDVALKANVSNSRFSGKASSKAANILVGIGYNF